MSENQSPEVIVVGSGNAGLCAAIGAAESGAKVCVIEKAPEDERGGNSALTNGMRVIAERLEELLALSDYAEGDAELDEIAARFQPRSAAAYRLETMTVTDGRADPALLDVLIRESYPTLLWLKGLGNNWVLARRGVSDNLLKLDGGGRSLQAHNYLVARRLGVEFRFGTAATDLLLGDDGAVRGLRVLDAGGYSEVSAEAVILASGGFEASAEMRGRYLGTGWDTVPARGVPYNTGDGLRMALAIGAATAGSWTTCHAAPQDVRRPDGALPSTASGGGTEWDRFLYPYGVMVDRDGERFVDEGADILSRTYARMGREILKRPGAVAFQIFDAKVREAGLMDPRYDRATGHRAATIEELAEGLGIDPEALRATIDRFNEGLVDVPSSAADATRLDGVGTVGVDPPKSNFARRIDQAPFEGYAVGCGITFTFGGLAIDPETAQVRHTAGRPVVGLYAAGEVVGGLWHGNYAGGSGMAAGSVFGRIAGRSAALATASRREIAHHAR